MVNYFTEVNDLLSHRYIWTRLVFSCAKSNQNYSLQPYLTILSLHNNSKSSKLVQEVGDLETTPPKIFTLPEQNLNLLAKSTYPNSRNSSA